MNPPDGAGRGAAVATRPCARGRTPNLLVFRHDRRIAIASGGDDDLVGRIAVERRRQLAAFDQNRPRQLDQMEPGRARAESSQ